MRFEHEFIAILVFAWACMQSSRSVVRWSELIGRLCRIRVKSWDSCCVEVDGKNTQSRFMMGKDSC
jgi:hypothetical protein